MNNAPYNDGVSIIAPTYCEIENLPVLIKQIDALCQEQRPLELIIVDDDSPDGTEAWLSEQMAHLSWLRFISRKNERGLASAVLDGFRVARFPVLVCMDADLSHPADIIPKMVDLLYRDEAIDMVIGSRFVKGSSVYAHWPLPRKLNAVLARLLAHPFTRIHDPLSGFFALRKSQFDTVRGLNPIGYKIGLELIVKCPCRHVVEIPIQFSQRHRGKSKLTFKEQFNYLIHLSRLTAYKFRCSLDEPRA